MTRAHTDSDLEAKIEHLRSTLEKWIRDNDLWYDCGFKSWAEHYNDEPPESPCVLLFWSEGPMHDVFNSYDDRYDEFFDLVESTGFHMEMEDHITASFWIWDDDALEAAFRDYFEWRWILTLIQPAYIDLYEEVFQRFGREPAKLEDLKWRQFEVVLDGIFRNNGFRTELGTGQADGGVDLRLYHNDVVGEALTLVQARRYRKDRPIRLEAVQALSAAVEDERANRGLFVTTSRYFPSAQKFASRQNRKLVLATSSEVQQWADMASRRIIRDKSQLVSHEHVLSLLSQRPAAGLEGTVVHAHTGYNIVANEFALVVRATPGAALLLRLPIRHVSGDGQAGWEEPRIEPEVVNTLGPNTVFRALVKRKPNGDVSLWGQRELYSPWDGKPQHFNHAD